MKLTWFLYRCKTNAWAVLLAVGMLSACGGGHDDSFRIFSSTVTAIQGGTQNVPPFQGSGLITFNRDDRNMIASLVVTASAPLSAVQIQEAAGNANSPTTIPLVREGNTNVWSTEVILNPDQSRLLESAQYYFRAISLSSPTNDGSGQIFEELPSDPDWNVLVDASAVSPRLRREIDIVDVVVNDDFDRSGVGVGLAFGF